jgi:O-antigen ligase
VTPPETPERSEHLLTAARAGASADKEQERRSNLLRSQQRPIRIEKLDGTLSSFYRGILGSAVVCVFYSGLTTLLLSSGITLLTPLRALEIFFVASLPVLMVPTFWSALFSSSTVVWFWIYGSITAASFFWSSRGFFSIQDLKYRLLGVLFITLLVPILADRRALKMTMFAMRLVILLGVGLNIYELLHPGAFSFALGRSAGMYQNPNISAAALICGLIVTTPNTQPLERAFFYLAVGVGVLLTFSRAGVVAWSIVTLIMIGRGQLRISRISTVLVLVVLSGFLFINFTARGKAISTIAIQTSDGSNSLGRVFGASDQIQRGEASADTRLRVARAAWELFKQNPILGAGVGSTTGWAVGESPHNMFLRFSAEYGVVGFILFPCLVLPVAWRLRARHPAEGLALAVFFVFWGFFSHNVVEEWPLLTGLACASAIGLAQANRRSVRETVTSGK